VKKVVVLNIEDYELDTIKQKVERSLLEHFSLPTLFSSGDKILLKPNLLMDSSPQEAIVTHPIFIEAVGRIFKDLGYSVFVADSPGGFVSNKDMNFIYEGTGVKGVAERNEFSLLYPTDSVIYQGIPFCWWVNLASKSYDSEGKDRGDFKIVNLPKLKTHDLMVLTLAVKNLYGCISGLYKSHLHRLHPTTDDLVKVILNLYKMITPSLNIVDGIVSLQGEGPARKGNPKKTKLVVIGNDALYTDYVIGRLLGLKDNYHPLIREAKEEGIIKEEDLEVISEVKGAVKDFVFPSTCIINRLPKPFLPLFRYLLKFRPVIERKKCTSCSVCSDVCPVEAITLKEGKATIDYRKCIMCMCCREVCRFGAVDLDKSFLLKLFDSLQ
jgi:uncharacterized protein (DUF362 family)/Pyruvate/2-oxoacid:ferredoxin oxidoreductase delta subunit